MRETAARAPKVDLLAMAVDAIVEGGSVDAYWETLAAFCERDGVDAVAHALARRGGPSGPSKRWWRCNLLLSTELPPEAAVEVARELVAVEAAGEGQVFDVDRHALEVSTAIRYLQSHLERLKQGSATAEESAAAATIVRAARVARRCGGGPAVAGRSSAR
jgi:hypothetical protein